MSGEKTEKPTDKKLEDSAKKGQSYKSKDAVSASIIAAGVLGMSVISLAEVGEVFSDFLNNAAHINNAYVADRVVRLFLYLTMPFVGICIVATIVPSLVQSKFVLAFEAVKIDFDSLNPVNGFKKIFNLKTVKEFVKAIIYIVVFSCVVYAFFKHYEHVLIDLVYVQKASVIKIWVDAGTTIVLLCLLAFVVIIVADSIIDYFLYIKDQKMEKHEVKEEYKQQEGNQEVKSHRREMHKELLSGQEKTEIEQSNFILANPTHIAIGIYLNFKISPLPFISLLAKGEKALAIIAYAEKLRKPVVRDILVARRLFKTAKRYSFIPMDMLEPIYAILIWLEEVESAHLKDSQVGAIVGADDVNKQQQ